MNKIVREVWLSDYPNTQLLRKNNMKMDGNKWTEMNNCKRAAIEENTVKSGVYTKKACH